MTVPDPAPAPDPVAVPAAGDGTAAPAAPASTEAAGGAAAHDEGPAGSPGPSSSGGPRAVLGGTLGVAVWSVLVVALAVAGVLIGVRLHDSRQQADARAAALVAARQEALNLTSVDPARIEAGLQAVLAGATGQFRTEFAGQVVNLRSVLAQNKVRSEGTVLAAAVVRADASSATALVVLDYRISNKAAPTPQTRPYRMQLDVEKVGDRWLTSSVQFVA